MMSISFEQKQKKFQELNALVVQAHKLKQEADERIQQDTMCHTAQQITLTAPRSAIKLRPRSGDRTLHVRNLCVLRVLKALLN